MIEKQIDFYYDYKSALNDILDLLGNIDNSDAINEILRDKKHIKIR